VASAMYKPATRPARGRPEGLGRATPQKLLVLGIDAADMVSGAGGLICDSVRAGLHVDAYLKDVDCKQALQILGVSAQVLPGAGFDFGAEWPDVIVFAAALQLQHQVVGRLIADAARGRRADLAVWGGTWPTDFDAGVKVEHRLSAAAQAFKLHAMRAVGATPKMTWTEPFHAGKNHIADPAPPLLAR
jgi:hypothetical protein